MPPATTPAAPLGRPRLGGRREVLLALLPTLTVLGLLWLLKALSNQQLLFASLASSCFLIYLDPSHPANSARTLVVSQLGAAGLGYLFHAWLGPSYGSAALALVSVIGLMIATNTMHPPAVATALNFAFRAGTGEGSLALFGLAVGLVVVLLAVQRGSAYLVRRFTAAGLVS
ncbi:HPP family protein [Hymenobacter cheonanensis]|uniref:HPP family protein n=1 Tax=Hymenobacter sp. CA2-7 TaxID=3063993 RepID=UPI0027130395|nr:HPP family protein [Hymenobacter sp. CA2-7]MDO7887142.1 HPP family protein [Hymenobacter sp. CA2-7]